jgi:hypothetical protein
MLNEKQRQKLVEIIDHEIKYFLSHKVPKYQSTYNMQLKYADNEEMQILMRGVKLQAYALTGFDVEFQSVWFNVCKEDSEFMFHRHDTLACVYYLKNCDGNGTLIIHNGKEEALPCSDNTLQFIASNVGHCVPRFNGAERYSVAFDLIKAS